MKLTTVICRFCGTCFNESKQINVDGKVCCSKYCEVANDYMYERMCEEWINNDELQAFFKAARETN